MPNNDTSADELQALLGHLTKEAHPEYVEAVVKDLQAWSDRRVADARQDGMERAKLIVLRRTEIPKDAKNPTRDAIVILGEEIADIISQVQAALKKEDQKHE